MSCATAKVENHPLEGFLACTIWLKYRSLFQSSAFHTDANEPKRGAFVLVLQIITIILCIAFFAYVVHLVAQEKLLLKYSLLWMALTVAILLCALFPLPLYQASSLLGFETPSNFIFFIGLFFLLAISLSLSLIVSKQASKIKNF